MRIKYSYFKAFCIFGEEEEQVTSITRIFERPFFYYISSLNTNNGFHSYGVFGVDKYVGIATVDVQNTTIYIVIQKQSYNNV